MAAFLHAKEWSGETLAELQVDAGFAIFGGLQAATEGSGKSGTSFTSDGTHWNDVGAKVMAKGALPVLNFVGDAQRLTPFPRPHDRLYHREPDHARVYPLSS